MAFHWNTSSVTNVLCQGRSTPWGGGGCPLTCWLKTTEWEIDWTRRWASTLPIWHQTSELDGQKRIELSDLKSPNIPGPITDTLKTRRNQDSTRIATLPHEKNHGISKKSLHYLEPRWIITRGLFWMLKDPGSIPATSKCFFISV